MSHHFVPIVPCAPNMRDLGGLRAGAHGWVRRGVLFRSEHLAPPAEDMAPLATLGIRTALDLRSDAERSRAPNAWLSSQGVTIHEVDVTADFRASADLLAGLLADPSEAGAVALMTGTYGEMPHAARRAVKTAADIIVTGEVPLLIHCTAGKDRTGFVCAMLLLAVGVPEDAVMEDFLLSQERRHHHVSNATRLLMADAGIEIDDAMLGALNSVRANYLATALRTIDQDFGGLERYLDMADVSRERLRDALIA